MILNGSYYMKKITLSQHKLILMLKTFHSSKAKNIFLKVVWHKQGPRAIVKNGEQTAEMPSSKLLGLGFYFLFNTSYFNLHL